MRSVFHLICDSIHSCPVIHSLEMAFTVLLQCLFAAVSYLPRSHSSVPLMLREETQLVNYEVRHAGELAHALTSLDSNVHFTIKGGKVYCLRTCVSSSAVA